MVKEEYVSFETAKLLKERGFECFNTNKWYYPEDGHIYEGKIAMSTTSPQVMAIPQSLVMRWLREVHNLHCDIGYDIELGWYHQIVNLKETVSIFDYTEMKVYHSDHDFGFHNYEEACEAAILYCLENLI